MSVRPAAAEPAVLGPAAAEASLEAISSLEWDALAGRGHSALRHAYLRAWEQCELRSLRSRPVIVPGGDGILAASPGHLYDMDLCAAGWPAGERFLAPARRLWPRLGFARTYELGSPTPLTDPFLIDSRVNRREAVAAVIDAAVAAGESAGATFLLVQNFPTRVGPDAAELRDRGFIAVPAPPTAVAALPYRSFDEYLSAMRAQYRRRVRQAFKRSRSLVVEHRTSFSDLAEDLAALWEENYLRAREFRRERLTAAVFRAMSSVPDTSVLLIRRHDGTIASFALLLDDRPWLLFLHCGFRESAGREEGAYFRLLYEIVRHGIDGGYDHVDLGMTTLEPKLDVGAVPVPLFVWARHRNPLAQSALGRLAEGPLRAPEIAPRRVFHDAPPSAAEIARSRAL